MVDLKILVIDVDGTLTDAGIYYDEHGNELKKFCTRDAAGIFAARNAGIKILILTGRECAATTRRMKELHVDYLIQGVKDKVDFIRKFIDENDLKKNEIGYIGDDLNDILPMKMAGYVACPADACSEVKTISNYVSTINGGHGAVRDIIENYLKESGEWGKAVLNLYGVGI